MQFIRENIFFAVLAGVFLLSVIIFIPVKMGQGRTYEERVALRQKIIDDCARNDGEPYVDGITVEEGKKSLAEIKEQATDVAKTILEKNCLNYKPLMLVKRDGTLIPAFPIDHKVYELDGLGLKYTLRYREWIEQKIGELAPTSVPTKAEIDNEIKTLELLIKAKKEQEDRIKAKENADTSETPEKEPRDKSPGLTNDGDVSRPNASGADNEDPKYLGKLLAKMARADKGRIYADVNAIQLVFPIRDANPPDTKLWDAEVSRWVFMDVLEAIKITNDQALLVYGTSIKKPTVLNSGVKRLVGMAVSRGYATAPTSTTGTGGGPSMAMPAPPMITGGQPGTTGKQTYLGLTGRVSCELYDVVHYNFTVVMAMNHLQTLQKNLLKQNLHTILGVRIVSVAASKVAGSTTGADNAEDLYYYGRDPVMKVTIYGELLLLTDWTRGMWDSKTRQWSSEFPPLVPVDVLKQDSMTSALRPEDKDRVKSQGK